MDQTSQTPSATCSVSWCSRKPLANGLCKSHYRRQRRKGQAVQLNHPDVEGVLASGIQVLDFSRKLVEKAHKANGHSTQFESCESGLCKEYHGLKQLFSSMEVTNGSEQPEQPEQTHA